MAGAVEDPNSQKANKAFIGEAMREPMLSREQECALARRWREQQDLSALRSLASCYMRLAISVAMRFRRYGLPVSDLIQEGNVGLMLAALRFDPDREVRFGTYAVWWIKASIQDYVLRNWSMVRVGTTAAQKTLFFNLRRIQARIDAVSGDGGPGESALAREAGVGVADIRYMASRLAAPDESLNEMVGEDGGAERLDLLRDERPTPEAAVTQAADADTRAGLIAAALDELPPREREIVRCRYLKEKPDTLETLGRRFGVSKERVRQLETRAMRKLRERLLQQIDGERMTLDDIL